MPDIYSTRPKKAIDLRPPPATKLESLARTTAQINDFGKSSTTAKILRQQQEINESLKGVLGLNSQSMKTIQHLTKLASRDIGVQTTALAAHPSWDSELKRISAQFSKTESSLRSAINGISRSVALSASRDLSVSAQVTQQITAGMLADNFKIEESVASLIRNSLTGFENTYLKLANSFEVIEDLVRRPVFVLPGATYEVVATGRVMESLLPPLNPPIAIDWEWEIDGQRDTDDVEEREPHASLEKINPKLALLLSGAWKAFESDNPDRPRHVLVSLRELMECFLDELAPRKWLEKWIDGRGEDGLLHEGQPTRRAKLLYIVRDVGNDPLVDFVGADAKVMKEMFKLFNRLHEVETGLTDGQLRTLIIRTEYYLRFLMDVRAF